MGVNDQQTPVFRPKPFQSNGASLVLIPLVIRWLAGIFENFGVPALSELTAVAMLCILLLTMLMRMRISADVKLFCAGIIAWAVSGTLASVANADADPRTTVALLTLLVLYGLFVNGAFSYLRTRTGIIMISLFATGFVLIGSSLSVFQILTNTGFVEAGKSQIQRAYGSDVHPVSFAIQILASMIIIEMSRLKLGRRITISHIALLAIGAGALYLTYARTAWLMALIVLAAGFILRGSTSRRILATIFALTFGLVFLLNSDRFSDLSSLSVFWQNFSIDETVFDWRYVDNSVSWRIVNWSYGLQQALEQPWLGFGPGQSAQSSYFNLEMHNIFLEVFFEGGIFGLSAFLLTLAGLVGLHRCIPFGSQVENKVAVLAHSFGFSLLLAVTFSTSFVDQLMSFTIYILLLSVASTRADMQIRINE